MKLKDALKAVRKAQAVAVFSRRHYCFRITKAEAARYLENAEPALIDATRKTVFLDGDTTLDVEVER